MATITLREGDFGADGAVRFDADDLFLPDPDRPGLIVPVPLAGVTEIEAIADDRTAQLKEAAALAFDGFRRYGPAGLVMGAYGATKVKDVVFSVVLEDGRGFVAATDARTFAELHAAQLAARSSVLGAGLHSHPADAVIAKYIGEAKAPPPAVAPVQPATIAPPAVRTAQAPRRERPAFGRRGQ